MGNEESGFAQSTETVGEGGFNIDSKGQRRSSSPLPRVPQRPSQSPMVTMYGKNAATKFTGRSAVGDPTLEAKANLNGADSSSGSNSSGGNRNRRPSLRAPATKRELNPQIGVLKRTKSNCGSEFFHDATINEDHEIAMLSAKLGSRRVSITSDDDDDGQIANIVASTAAQMTNNMKAENINMKTKPSNNTASVSTSKLPNSIKPSSNRKNKGIGSSVANLIMRSSSVPRLKSNSVAETGKKKALGMRKSSSLSKLKTAATEKKSEKKKSFGPSGGPGWSIKQDNRLKELIEKHGSDWKAIQAGMPGRTEEQCIHRWNKVLKPGLRKGTWTPEEDARLIKLVYELKKRNWGDVAALIKGRTAKQCRERWCYNLDPSINKNVWTPEEDQILIKSQGELGNRWAHIASLLPGRTENAVKTRFKSIMRAKKREWLPEEDAMILKMHQDLGSRWEAIAAKLPTRTKNAVKTRFRLLGKGLAGTTPEIGSPNQVLRSKKLKNASLADLTKQVAEAHKTRSKMNSGDVDIARNYEFKEDGRGNASSSTYERGDVSIVPPVPEFYNGFQNNNNTTSQGEFLGQLDLFNSATYGDTQNTNTFGQAVTSGQQKMNMANTASPSGFYTFPDARNQATNNASRLSSIFDESNEEGYLNPSTAAAQDTDELMEFFDMWDQGTNPVLNTK
mmetsp:Transcript_14181/g.16445  ORF Transcript_14181/g.16445 Transcript_14181/m.16445 type:complete len:677 (+) Transcript_14181:334-2364(+)